MRVADTGELIAGGSLLVASSGPGLFTVNQNGTGAAAAYNQDNTLNSASNRRGPRLGNHAVRDGAGAGEPSRAGRDSGTGSSFCHHRGGADIGCQNLPKQSAFHVRTAGHHFWRGPVFGLDPGIYRVVANQCEDSPGSADGPRCR